MLISNSLITRHKTSTMTAPTNNEGRQGLNAASWWTVNRSNEPPLQMGATLLVEKCVAELGWSLEFALQVLDGYQKFLNFRNMFQDYDGKKFLPPTPIDQMWKKHMQDTANYDQDCQLLFGRLIHRQEGPLDEETKNRRIERTLYVLRLQCKDEYNRAVWDFGRGTVDTAPTQSSSKRGGLRKNKRVDWRQKLAEQDSLTSVPSSSRKRKQCDAEQNRKNRLTEDGCMLPARPAKKNANGTFSKPVGRTPAGMEWDCNRGVFAPAAQYGAVELNKTAEPPAIPKKRMEPAIRARLTGDGCLHPAREPKKNADGTFVKPVGRVPTGMEWDENRGLFAPTGSPTDGVVASKKAQKKSATPRALPFKENRPRVKSTPDARKGRKTEDGYYLPPTTPRRAEDGTFIRPAGRGPVGMVWDSTRGAYAPFSHSNQVLSSPDISIPWVTPTASISDSDESSRMVRRISQDIEGEEATA